MPNRSKPAPPKTGDNDHQHRLEQLRDRLVAELAGHHGQPSSAAVAALARELRSVLADLAALSPQTSGPSFADELKQRRAQRRTDAEAVSDGTDTTANA